MSDKTNNVMIVDDDAHVRIAVRTILYDAGFHVIAADSGSQCIDLLKKGFTGVILLDIMMPEMDGWDTIRAILDNKLEENIAIIMLTAKNVPDKKMIGLQEYVVDYITKPFDNEDLIQKTSFIMSYVHDRNNMGITAE
ncbi:PleD family two-component system response regulator [Methanospirillum sp.]|uniref:response regulator n=1 Tax=Methanospirillum sp. TaxID=45200 RepID=UPI002987A992|nr:response regulator [Methanospirillum sp.]